MIKEIVNATVLRTYTQEYKVKNNITKKQRCIIIDTKECGMVFIRSAAKWANTISVGDRVNLIGTLSNNQSGMTFLNNVKLKY